MSVWGRAQSPLWVDSRLSLFSKAVILPSTTAKPLRQIARKFYAKKRPIGLSPHVNGLIQYDLTHAATYPSNRAKTRHNATTIYLPLIVMVAAFWSCCLPSPSIIVTSIL